jgi:putative RNA 2'-phosphotransferase
MQSARSSESSLLRTLSRMLRHTPELYFLDMDRNGWVSLQSVVTALRCARREWSRLRASELQRLLAEGSADQFEWDEERIRARYGHSVSDFDAGRCQLPPDLLYHGTDGTLVPPILAEGLSPMRRQYVHLTNNLDYAQAVASVKGDQPIVLTIHSRDAADRGTPFWPVSSHVWLTNHVPPEFIVNPYRKSPSQA